MKYYFSDCKTLMYQHRYMDFLLAHYSELNMPYSFSTTLGYISSPLFMTGSTILCFDDEDETAGAFGFIHGTGEHNYEDQHVIQLQVAFVVSQHRGSRIFIEGLRFLVQHLDEYADEVVPVEEIRFWALHEVSMHRLFSKFAARMSSTTVEAGMLNAYAVKLVELRAYLASFEREDCVDKVRKG
ncbi:hypothetical protein NKT34_04290 [Paenibacillus polysaccharolyticus]|uniref:hypothetical protein n=1 Tax=Paenibacillus polysaccharolyticus TaxID=582692 RepID=UPI00209D33C9|nr:hypothetical protein [Paenibacillus polysaccharolyticus]MCP1132497.1 hypothetical protein [Paenibacillus polysaccharolyticus]